MLTRLKLKEHKFCREVEEKTPNKNRNTSSNKRNKKNNDISIIQKNFYLPKVLQIIIFSFLKAQQHRSLASSSKSWASAGKSIHSSPQQLNIDFRDFEHHLHENHKKPPGPPYLNHWQPHSLYIQNNYYSQRRPLEILLNHKSIQGSHLMGSAAPEMFNRVRHLTVDNLWMSDIPLLPAHLISLKAGISYWDQKLPLNSVNFPHTLRTVIFNGTVPCEIVQSLGKLSDLQEFQCFRLSCKSICLDHNTLNSFPSLLRFGIHFHPDDRPLIAYKCIPYAPVLNSINLSWHTNDHGRNAFNLCALVCRKLLCEPLSGLCTRSADILSKINLSGCNIDLVSLLL